MRYFKYILLILLFFMVATKVYAERPGYDEGGYCNCESVIENGKSICKEKVNNCVSGYIPQCKLKDDGSCVTARYEPTCDCVRVGVGDAELPNYPDSVGFKFKDKTLGEIIGKIIEYIYIFAGFALLIALFMGGFTVLTAAGSPEKAQKGYNQATYGVIGFIIIFVSYMVVLLIQAIFHVKIFF